MNIIAKLVLASVLLLPPVVAQAEDQGTETERQACEPDVNSTCKDAIPDRPKIIRCLAQNVKILTPPCANIIRFYSQQRFCAPDAASLCPDTPAKDREGVVQCLEKNRAKLSSTCGNALKTFLSAGRS